VGESDAGEAKSEGSNRTAIIVAVITLVGVLGAAYITGIFGAKKSDAAIVPRVTATESKKTIPVSGSIEQSSGNSISQAKLSFFEDQSAPIVRYSDTDGHFAILVPPNTQVLRVTVDAEGFESVTKQLSLEATGPEEIIMHPAAKSASPLKTKPFPPLQTAISSSPQASPAPQPVCAPGVVNCNLAPNEGDQSVHFHMGESKAPPIASILDQRPLPAEDKTKQYTKDEVMSGARSYQEGDLRFNPGTVVYIGVDRIFDDPTFDFDCDFPCSVTGSKLVTNPKEGMIATETIAPDSSKMTADGLHHRISFTSKLGRAPKSAMELHIRSVRENQPVKVTSLRSTDNP
jgi:hypothetical protein